MLRSAFARRGLFVASFGLSALLLSTSRDARANGLEVGENGTEVMGRGGAWTARADNALAAALNPAGLAGQATNVVVNANFTWQSECFQRAGSYPNGGNFSGTGYSDAYYDKAYPEVCKKNGLGDINVIPQIGFTYAVTPKLGIGILPLWTPSGTGKAIFPDDSLDPSTHRGDVVTSDGTPAPAPQRFMLLNKNSIIVMPTFGVGYEIAPRIRIGASFQWVITVFKSALSSQGTQTSAQDVAQGPYTSARSDVSFTQIFTPAAVLGALASPSDDVDIGFMFRWSADIVKKGGDVTITAPYYGNSASPKYTPAETQAHIQEFRIPQPWEARLGFRWHPLRNGVTAPKDGRRDVLAYDQADVEVDFTYEHNSQMDQLTILFDEGQHVAFGSSANASFVPPDASIPKHWKDVYGARFGGDYVVLPNKLAARVGGYVRSQGQDPQYLHLDFHEGAQLGLYLGATYRISKTVDIAAGYGHVFVKTFDNTATGGAVRGLVGTQPNAPGSPKSYDYCSDPNVPAYRTCDPINTGRLTSSYNIFSLGTTLHF